MLRAGLDAAFFHLYLPANADGSWKKSANETDAEYGNSSRPFPTPRETVGHIMDSFPITRNNDLARYGFFHAKERILAEFDVLAEAMRAGADPG